MADELCKTLGLSPHPYGGYFKEIYRATSTVKPLEDERQSRTAGSCIYFIMKSTDIDPWHRLKSDSTFLYHKGTHLKMYIIDSKGDLQCKILGDTSQDCNAMFACTIPAGAWFGGELANKYPDSFGLYSVFVCPGFEFGDSEIGEQTRLAELFPQHKELFERLCLQD